MNAQTEKKRGQYSVLLTQQAWSINDLLYGKRTLIFLWDTTGIPGTGFTRLRSQ